MSPQNQIKNVAIVGASGRLGSQLVTQLLLNPQFSITAVSRSSSSATFPPEVNVVRGDYSSSSFLDTALQAQDVLIIAIGFEGSLDLATGIIEAAGRAGVKWIIPNEWSSDGANEELCSVFTLLGEKRKYREQIENLGDCAWVGISNNPWFDYSLKSGWFGINIPNRKAMIFDGGETQITTTSIPQVCRGVAALLSLPITTPDDKPSLSDYKNSFVYLSSFQVTQNEIFASVQRATGTKRSDWSIEEKSTEEYIEEGKKEKEEGKALSIVKVLYGSTFKNGLGDKFYGREVANQKLGLSEESLDNVVKRVVGEVEEENKQVR